jgi:preprotein translocase subunit YajC
MLATNIFSLTTLRLLAESTQPSGNPLMQLLPMILVIVVVFYFVVFRPQRKQTSDRKQMLESLRKGDKVLTIGGMIGTIVNIKDNEITVKVDESTNTRITFVRSAIDRLLSTRESGKQEAA